MGAQIGNKKTTISALRWWWEWSKEMK